jgi:hypothetical protein
MRNLNAIPMPTNSLAREKKMPPLNRIILGIKTASPRLTRLL